MFALCFTGVVGFHKMNIFDVFEYVVWRLHQVLLYKRMVCIVLIVGSCLLEVSPMLFDSYIYFIVNLDSCVLFYINL